ncbi:MAG: phosphoribosylanthranilate isomerase [Pseudomonadota bacterium]
MALVVKICGVTSAEAIEAVIAAGVDRVGFVFAPSPRQVSPMRARQLAMALPRHIERVAVLKKAAQDAVSEVLASFPADWIQADASSLTHLSLPPTVRAMPVLRDGEVAALRCVPSPLLYEAPVSGQGVRADWNAAAELAKDAWLMLAGGLHPSNVAQAVRQVQPAGVDVSSGVERAPGEKDPERIAAFVAAAREAASTLSTRVGG